MQSNSGQSEFFDQLPYWEQRLLMWKKIRPRQSRFLYKYRSIDTEDEESLDRLRQIIVDNTLWFSAPLDFNDPFDLAMDFIFEGPAEEVRKRIDQVLKNQSVPFKKRKKRVAAIMSGKTLGSNFKEKLAQNLREHHPVHLSETGVCSFAGHPRSIPMWSYYADSHAGICLQFERARDTRLLIQSVRVKYSNKFPTINYIKDLEEQLAAVVLQKSKDWKHEEEQRIILPENGRRSIPFHPDALTGMIFGLRTPDETKRIVKQMANARADNGQSTPRLYQAVRKPGRYDLGIYRS
ncbi:MAG: DUF2971 domain-containing protein [Pseudomonadota bacterium]